MLLECARLTVDLMIHLLYYLALFESIDALPLHTHVLVTIPICYIYARKML